MENSAWIHGVPISLGNVRTAETITMKTGQDSRVARKTVMISAHASQACGAFPYRALPRESTKDASTLRSPDVMRRVVLGGGAFEPGSGSRATTKAVKNGAKRRTQLSKLRILRDIGKAGKRSGSGPDGTGPTVNCGTTDFYWRSSGYIAFEGCTGLPRLCSLELRKESEYIAMNGPDLTTSGSVLSPSGELDVRKSVDDLCQPVDAAVQLLITSHPKQLQSAPQASPAIRHATGLAQSTWRKETLERVKMVLLNKEVDE
ncbi:hypothetical protein C8J57DRAFT_1238685 [Mycena rebaudengoi]|nr:hypothetical protein C8J57DRAFT_1238685 [Mycena rebaudengoi]